MSDIELLLLLRTHPNSGLSKVIDIYSGLVYAVVYSKIALVCPKEDIEECASDVFSTFYLQIPTIDLEKGSIKSFITVLAKRTAISYYRKKLLKKNLNPVAIDDDNFTEELISDDNVEMLILNHAEQQLLIDAVNNLGRKNSEVIYRRFYYNQSIEQIASQMNLTKFAVHKRIERSLKKLKIILGGLEHEW